MQAEATETAHLAERIVHLNSAYPQGCAHYGGSLQAAQERRRDHLFNCILTEQSRIPPHLYIQKMVRLRQHWHESCPPAITS